MTDQILFFPFTHVTQKQRDAVSAFFHKFICMPPEYLESALPKAQEYLEWAKIHKGNEHNLKALLKENPYFTSDTHIPSIKSQIKGAQEKIKAPLKNQQERLEKDLLFLAMAGLSDEQNEQIDLELKGLDKNREELVNALRGIENLLDEVKEKISAAPQDNGAVMTKERINAWFNGMRAEKMLDQAGEFVLFVTTSPAVFDYFESNCSDVVNALDIDQIKVHENKCKVKIEWQNQLKKCLMNAILVKGNRGKDQTIKVLEAMPDIEDDCQVSGQIKLGLFSGDMINTLLNDSEKQAAVCLINLK